MVGILESGLPRLLLGLLRCTDDIELLCSASQLLSVLTHGSDTVRTELAKLKTVSVLIPLLLPPPPQAKVKDILIVRCIMRGLASPVSRFSSE